MWERHQLFCGLQLVSKEFQSRNPNQNRAALWQFFLSNKSVPANRKTGLDANRDLNKQEVEFIFHEAAQNLESFHIFKSKI
jgi:hypothetical protein